jgi:hypothetical protein
MGDVSWSFALTAAARMMTRQHGPAGRFSLLSSEAGTRLQEARNAALASFVRRRDDGRCPPIPENDAVLARWWVDPTPAGIQFGSLRTIMMQSVVVGMTPGKQRHG